MAFHVLNRGFAQGEATTPDLEMFVQILHTKGWREAIPLLRRAVDRWNVDPAQPDYQKRRAQAVAAARVAITFATQAHETLLAMASGWDDWWKAGALTLPFQIAGHRELLAAAKGIDELLNGSPGTAGLILYIEQGVGIVRIQRVIQILFDRSEAALQLMDDLRASFTGKMLEIANRIVGLVEKTLDTAAVLYEAILALLKALAQIVMGVAKYWPIVLAVGGGLILWWVFGGGRERARAA